MKESHFLFYQGIKYKDKLSKDLLFLVYKYSNFYT